MVFAGSEFALEFEAEMLKTYERKRRLAEVHQFTSPYTRRITIIKFSIHMPPTKLNCSVTVLTLALKLKDFVNLRHPVAVLAGTIVGPACGQVRLTFVNLTTTTITLTKKHKTHKQQHKVTG